ncbi:MAG TPA: hypothetical protein VH113_04860, partial [Gemmatimonadales bacterium]|nr:hypothetical protein [Gemmatimonadales bacterium]
EIRPLDAGEVLDGALTLYRRNFGLFLRLAAATLWLPIAGIIYFQVRMAGVQPDQMAALMQANIGGFIGWFFLFIVVYLIGFLLLTAGSIHIISASYLGKPTGLSESLSLAFSRVLPLIGVGFGKGLLILVAWMAGGVGIVLLATVAQAVGGGALSFLVAFPAGIALIWGVIYLYCGYGVTTEVIVLEDLDGAFDAFGRSWNLTKGARGKVFGMFIVSWIIVNLIPTVVLAVASGMAQASMPSLVPFISAGSSLLTLALAPIIPCVFTLLYYDLRARREGFDLEHLGRQLGLA